MNSPASKPQGSLLPIGTKIRFTKTLTCAATGDHPAFLFAEKGDEGEITGHGTKEGYWAKTSYNPPFGVSREEFEPIESPKPQGSEQPWKCEICGRPVPDYVPEYCCNGTDCNCHGAPIDSCVCSQKCSEALFSGIGKTMERRRIDAGIAKWLPNPSADEKVERLISEAVEMYFNPGYITYDALCADIRNIVNAIRQQHNAEREEWQAFDKIHRSQIEFHQSEIRQLRASLAEKERENTQLKRENENTWRAHGQIVSQLSSLQSELATAQRTIEKLTEELDWQNKRNSGHPTRGGFEFYINEEWTGLASAAVDGDYGWHATLAKRRFDPDDERVRVRRVAEDDELLREIQTAMEERDKAIRECVARSIETEEANSRLEEAEKVIDEWDGGGAGSAYGIASKLKRLLSRLSASRSTENKT